MAKDELIQVRVTPELKERIRKCAVENGYEDMSKFILDLIDNRIDENKWNNSIRKELLKILKDPIVVSELLQAQSEKDRS